MNYKKIHDDIIERALNRNIEGYTERHHIVPKCMGGSNKKDNIAVLTAKEHFIIHRLLTFIYPDNFSLVYACWAMCGLLNNQYRKDKRYVPSAKVYGRLKKEASEAKKKSSAEYNHWTGKKHTEESKKKQSESAKNRNTTPENEKKRRLGISEHFKKLQRTPEWNENSSIAKTGDKNPMFNIKYCDNKRSKKVLQYTLENVFIKEWCNSKEASETLELGYKAIMNCASGKTKTSGGFIWKYKQ